MAYSDGRPGHPLTLGEPGAQSPDIEQPRSQHARLDRRAYLRGAAGFVTGAAVGAVAAQAQPAWLGVTWAATLVIFAPTSPRLDRRVALNLALVFGLSPVFVWVPSFLGPRTAAIAALGMATGSALCTMSLRRHRLAPEVRRRDGFILLTAILAGLVASPLRSVDNADEALRILSTGIDNSSHFAMYLEQRLAAVHSPLMSANADSSGFAFAGYPQWFHKTLTCLAQLAFGDVESATTELVRYTQLQWLVFCLLATLVTAAFMQALPEHVRGSLLLPALAIVFSLVVGVPGVLSLIYGHLSFLVATCAPLLIFLLALPLRHPRVGLYIVLFGLLAVSASWAPLLPLSAAALTGPLLPIWRRLSTAQRSLFSGGLALATAGALAALVTKASLRDAFSAILRDGAVPRVGLPTMAAVFAGSIILIVALGVRHHQVALGRHLALAVSATLTVLILGSYMLWASGELTYYFWKLGLGSLMVNIVVTTHAVLVVRAADKRVPRLKRGPILSAVAVSLCAAAGLGCVLQEDPGPSMLWSLMAPQLLGQRTASSEAGDVDLPLRLAASVSPADAARTRLLATRAQDMNPAHASAWFHAASYSATRRAMSSDDGVYDLALDRGDLALGVTLAQKTLALPGGRVVVTSTALYDAILGAVSQTDQARVLLLK